MAKVGIGVEGRFKGANTLFIDASEYPQMVPRDMNLAVTQIYISDIYNALDLWDDYLVELSQKYIITVERTALGYISPPKWVNIILNIESDSFWLLKGTAQVKFSSGQFIYAVAKENMSKTIPSDFDGGKEL